MGGSARLVLVLVPLAIYCATLGALQGSRRPRIVAGPADFGLLAFGLGGLIIFGPIGGFLRDRLFPAPSLASWLALATLYLLLVLLWLPRTARRLVIYNVDPTILRAAVRAALEVLPGSFAPTVRGFEDARAGWGFALEFGPRQRVATVEGYGRRPEPLVAALTPALRAALRHATRPPSRVARAWYALAGLTLAAALLLPALRAFPALRAALGMRG